jgi:hypothetical protein
MGAPSAVGDRQDAARRAAAAREPLRMWDLATGAPLITILGSGEDWARFDADDRLLASQPDKFVATIRGTELLPIDDLMAPDLNAARREPAIVRDPACTSSNGVTAYRRTTSIRPAHLPLGRRRKSRHLVAFSCMSRSEPWEFPQATSLNYLDSSLPDRT